MSTPPSRSQVLSLFRTLLRAAAKFPEYNIREYAKARAVDGFRRNVAVSDPSKAFEEGVEQLQVVRRQALVYGLYAPEVKSIMEIK